MSNELFPSTPDVDNSVYHEVSSPMFIERHKLRLYTILG